MTALSYRTNYKLQACEGQEPFFLIYINTILKHPCVHLKVLLNAPSQHDSSVNDRRTKFTDLIWQSAAEPNMMLNKSKWVFSKVSVLELNFLYFISQWAAVHRQIHQESNLWWKRQKTQTNFGPHFNSRTQIPEPPKLTLAERLFSVLILQTTNCIYVLLYSKCFSCSYRLWNSAFVLWQKEAIVLCRNVFLSSAKAKVRLQHSEFASWFFPPWYCCIADYIKKRKEKQN